MIRFNKYLIAGSFSVALLATSCVPALKVKNENTSVPNKYGTTTDTTNNAADIKWSEFFSDPYLAALIDTALGNNQELNIMLQEIQIAQQEVRTRKGEYLPFVGLGAGAGVDKTARYTPFGANEATTEIEPGREMPDPVPDFLIGAYANWEVDIWKKLRNAKQAAISRYLASQEGKNFMVTNLVSEIAESYYELLALDNQLALVGQNIKLQSSALEVMKLQKQSGKLTELAVKRFEAQVYSIRSLEFEIKQRIVEEENKINFLVGRYPQAVERNQTSILDIEPKEVSAGIPSQMLANRPDIRQAELQLVAAKLDVKSAKANFYPRLDISAAIGLNAFNPTYLVKAPESIMYSLAGDLVSPLINRNAIKATYYSANSKQIQAVYAYEQTILNGYIEVYNQLYKIENLNKSYDLRLKQVEALTRSITISNDLFQSARADYREVLMTQRDALESKFELIDTRKAQFSAMVNVYRALGGGWQ